jgi:hypothetical protein
MYIERIVNVANDAMKIRNKSTGEEDTLCFNVVEAMQELGKEFVEGAGELVPEEMADNLMPVLTVGLIQHKYTVSTA